MSKPRASASGARESLDDAEQPWYKNRALIMTLLVTAWMLSIAKYNDELGPIFVSAPIKQVRSPSAVFLTQAVTAEVCVRARAPIERVYAFWSIQSYNKLAIEVRPSLSMD